MKYFVRTFGCKTNQYESELIKHLVELQGDTIAEDYCEADIVIINSCAVTQPAERDVYKFIRRVYRESKSTKKIFVVGCYAEYIIKHNLYDQFFERLAADIPVDFFGNEGKYKFISLSFCRNNFSCESNCTIKKFFGKKRAYVKIQDGCNNFCSYCIVPYLRSSVFSRPLPVVLNEIEELVKNGYNEIYLVGTNIGKYYYQNENRIYDYVDLSEHILQEFPMVTLLYSSLEPVDLTQKFFSFLEKYRNRIFPHFHVPLQSADDSVLHDMNRNYSVEEYINKITCLRKIMPEAIISTDIIVGYPTETKEKFVKTLNFIEEMKFNWVHVFPYSPRIGTIAYKKYGNFVCYDSKSRVREVNRLNEKLGEKYFKTLCKVL